MSRFFAFAVGSLAVSAAFLAWTGTGCTDAPVAPDLDPDAGSSRRDSSPVEPPSEGGPIVEAGVDPSATSCTKYCDLVMTNCRDENAQYGSSKECLSFCHVLPPDQVAGEEKSGPSLPCRAYWADSPARTNPKAYCLAAGPFGGNVCGDRCTAYCGILLSACTPDGGNAVYPTQPDCATACAGFSYLDAGVDGGGEAPTRPTVSDTLNCRLYHLRAAVLEARYCSLLVPDGGACEPSDPN